MVGAGWFGTLHFEAWDRLGCEIVGVHTPDPAGAAALCERHGAPHFDDLAAMVEATAPDLVDIVAPPQAHLPSIRAALAAGAPAIQCQKPFCGGLADAEAAVAAAAAAGATLAVHENVRFQPWYREAKRLLDAGALGEPYQVNFRLRPGDGAGPDAYLGRQPYFRDMARFLVHETAIHWIDTFRFLLGAFEGVTAHLVRRNPAIAGEDGGVILLDRADGTLAVFDANRLADHAAEDHRLTLGEMLLEGSEAALSLDGRGRLWLRRRGEATPREHAYDWRGHGFGGDCVHATCAALLAHLREGAPLENDARAYLANLRIEEAAYLSAAEGRRVALG